MGENSIITESLTHYGTWLAMRVTIGVEYLPQPRLTNAEEMINLKHILSDQKMGK
jgi:hypothetical protein